MSLFRRFRKDKEELTAEGGETEEGPSAAPPTSPPKTESEPPPQANASEAATPAPPPALEPPPLSSPPPPRLPERLPPEALRSRADQGPFGVCFVCGSVLEGRTCPTCRIAWVE